MSYVIPADRGEAEALDSHDLLGHARELFDLPDGKTYLVGHSLGPATHSALDELERTASGHWRNELVKAWNSAGWFDLPRTVGASLARLIGARQDEVIIADSVSINLFKLAAAARSIARTPALIVEEDEFPTDQYIIEALSKLSGRDFVRAKSGDGLAHLERSGGVLVLSAVNYRSGEIRNMAAAEGVAHSSGGVIVWDLSHATGVTDVNLQEAGARLATGCTYKYLNGGPGAPSFLYVRADTISRLESPLPGWMGHEKPFAFEPVYAPASGIQRFASGTPPILSLAALSGALEVFESIDMSLVHDKARALGELVIARADALGLEVASPRDGRRRGGHVSLRHPNGYEIVQALIHRGILADFREPDTIRFGLSPLFLRFTDVWDALDALADILATRAWDDPAFRQRSKVT